MMVGKTNNQIMMANPILKGLKKFLMTKTELKKVIMSQ